METLEESTQNTYSPSYSQSESKLLLDEGDEDRRRAIKHMERTIEDMEGTIQELSDDNSELIRDNRLLVAENKEFVDLILRLGDHIDETDSICDEEGSAGRQVQDLMRKLEAAERNMN